MRKIKQEKNEISISVDGTYETEIPTEEIEKIFSVVIKQGKIWEEPIVQKGAGQGSGEIISVKSRWRIEKTIEDINPTDTYIAASKKHSFCWYGGYAYLSLLPSDSDEIGSFSLESNSSFQACDDNHIILYGITQADEYNYFSVSDEDEEGFVEYYLKESKIFKKDIERLTKEGKSNEEIIKECEDIDSEEKNKLWEERMNNLYEVTDVSFSDRIHEDLDMIYSDIIIKKG